MRTMKENLIDKFHEADMLYFVLGSLISTDSLIDFEACHKALDCLENLKRDFETSTLKDDPKLKSFLNNAESIIKRDMNHFKENSTNKLKDTFWQRRILYLLRKYNYTDDEPLVISK